MELPFSHDAFLDVFGAYNSLLWPGVVLLWVVTAWLVGVWLRTGRLNGRALFGLLAVHWAWSGIAYHWSFFRGINPAAALFAALFVLQSVLFAWLALASRGHATVRIDLRGFIGAALVLYGLAYPFTGLILGLKYPRVPLFAVPCPTTLVTAGLLVTTVGAPRLVTLLPILWSIVGTSAAFALGVRADLALAVAAAVLTLDMLAPAALGVRPAA
jgi:hypothetical protein